MAASETKFKVYIKRKQVHRDLEHLMHVMGAVSHEFTVR